MLHKLKESAQTVLGEKPLNFIKMHGLGNDFVVFDARTQDVALSPQQVKAIADRRTGIGCDQLIIMSPSQKADIFMSIQNADGTFAEACGNATRCIGTLLLKETGKDAVTIETGVDILHCNSVVEGVRANMGVPNFNWQNIPLSEERDTLNLGLNIGALKNPVAVNVGNPHVVYFVKDVSKIDIANLGPMVEHYPLFPDRVNVNVVQVLSPDDIILRVWERGAGITRACGTGAAASVVAGVQRGLLNRQCRVQLLGGNLNVHWAEDNHIFISGAAVASYQGAVDLSTLANIEA